MRKVYFWVEFVNLFYLENHSLSTGSMGFFHERLSIFGENLTRNVCYHKSGTI